MTDQVKAPADDPLKDPFAETFNLEAPPDDTDKPEDKATPDNETDEQKAEREKKETEQRRIEDEKARQAQKQHITEAEQRFDRGADVMDFLTSDEGQVFKRFAPQIRQAARDKRWFNVPVSQLPQLILKPAAYSKVLSDARAAADEEAAGSIVGGATHKGLVPEELTKIDPKTMNKDEFAALRERAKRGEFKIKKPS